MTRVNFNFLQDLFFEIAKILSFQLKPLFKNFNIKKRMTKKEAAF